MGLQRTGAFPARGRAFRATTMAASPPPKGAHAMAKIRLPEIDTDDAPNGADAAALADTLVERGRAVLEQVPNVAAGAREALADAQEQVNGLSDLGIVAASGLALGVSTGLLLAGAPRIVVGLSTVLVFLTFRSAMGRGVRPNRLVN
jgi:hypothetical protein